MARRRVNVNAVTLYCLNTQHQVVKLFFAIFYGSVF